ncbi:MAG: hypothetical protein AABO58_23115 [Acidobacteriota bacterium]
MDKTDEATKVPSYVSATPADSFYRGGEAVIAKVPQGYDAKINIRFVPGRDIPIVPLERHCRARQGAPRRDAPTVALPPDLVRKLSDADKKVTQWLSKDAANAQLFLVRPVEALLRAGVDLTRAEQKVLDRSHRAASEERVIAPGVKVAQLSVTASTKGRVGDPRPRPKKNHEDGDCGCGESGKKE